MMDPWEEMMASFRGDEGEHQTLPVVASVHVRAHESVCRCVCVCVFFFNLIFVCVVCVVTEMCRAFLFSGGFNPTVL